MERALLSMEEKRERDRAIHEHEDSGDDAHLESEQDWIKSYFGWQLGLNACCICVLQCVRVWNSLSTKIQAAAMLSSRAVQYGMCPILGWWVLYSNKRARYYI